MDPASPAGGNVNPDSLWVKIKRKNSIYLPKHLNFFFFKCDLIVTLRRENELDEVIEFQGSGFQFQKFPCSEKEIIVLFFCTV